MHKRLLVRTLSVTLVMVPIALGARAQEKTNPSVGSWELVSSSDKNSDGSSHWGDNPKGTFIFEPNGRYAFIIVRSDMRKFAAPSIDKGATEENAMALRGALAHFGTYTYDAQSKTMTTVQEGSNFPNLAGITAKRTVSSVPADEMRYTNGSTATNNVAEAVCRRIK
jgi:hypothetical protein